MSEINVNEVMNPIEEVVPANLVQETMDKGVNFTGVAVGAIGAAVAVGVGYKLYKWWKNKQADKPTEEEADNIIDINAEEVEETE